MPDKTRCKTWPHSNEFMFVYISMLLLTFSTVAAEVTAATTADQAFESLAEEYVGEYPALAPVSATALGDHRFDSEIDQIGGEARNRKLQFIKSYLTRLKKLERSKLSRANQVDHALLTHELRSQQWRIEELQEWAWNPLVYTELCGSAVYNLMAREFTSESKRLMHVADRLEQFPRVYRQVRDSLQPARVPKIHAETALKQNRGVLSILKNMVTPKLGQLEVPDRQRLQAAIELATNEVNQHQKWLEEELLILASGDFRLKDVYDTKLAFTLQSSLSRKQIRERAETELKRIRAQMYGIAKKVYTSRNPYTRLPANPTPEYRQALIRAALEMAYEEVPPADGIVAAARKSLEITTQFVREKDLITLPPDPLEIIIMPEFQRGVSLAYCDSPGPLDVGQKTFYAVAPLPEDWTKKQIQSFVREYNIRSIHDLTVHEAMPGHFVQLAHSNRYPGKLRAVLASGVFIEGWAVYTEQMMVDEGFLNGDPLMKLIALKWYLRGIANAILDQAVHTDGMTRDQAMHLMMEDTFQEEREAAAKWIRAQLTGAQLSTYFVGYIEHVDLRRETELLWKDDFELKTYHDKVLSYGSPPVKFAGALLLDKPIPRD